MKNNILFSICVPTRNRAITLKYCIQTLIEQDFSNYEIIVSDNSDSLERLKVRKLIDEFNNQYLSYHETPTFYSMRENFEFALSKAQGKYILFLGDDDGFVLNSLGYLENYLQENGDIDVLKCPSIIYHWQGSINFPNSNLMFPKSNPILHVDAKSILKKVLHFEMAYFNLPMIYYSFVKKDLIDKVVEQNGSFFGSCISVDIFSGLVIAKNIKQFTIIDKPFTIAGISKYSNGERLMKKKEKENTEFIKSQNYKSELIKYKIPFSVQNELATLILIDNYKFQELYQDFVVDKKKQIFNYLVNIFIHSGITNEKNKLVKLDEFKQNGINPELIDQIKNMIKKDNSIMTNYSSINNLITQHYNFNPLVHNIKNIHEASLLSEIILSNSILSYNKTEKNINYFNSFLLAILKKIQSKLNFSI